MDIKYGFSATFNSAKDLYEAAGKVREEGYSNWECYTPIPVHGLPAALPHLETACTQVISQRGLRERAQLSTLDLLDEAP